MKTRINFGRWLNCVMTSPLLYTDNLETAEKSIFQWRQYGDSDQWVCSLLGIVNGILPKVGLVLVAVQPDKPVLPTPWRFRIQRWSAVFPGVSPFPR